MFDAEGTNATHPMAPCGSCSEEMIMNENVQPCWYQGESTSFTTNERDDLPLGALDGPGSTNRCATCWAANAQQFAFCPFVTNMAKDIPTNTLTNNWSAVGR